MVFTSEPTVASMLLASTSPRSCGSVGAAEQSCCLMPPLCGGLQVLIRQSQLLVALLFQCCEHKGQEAHNCTFCSQK